VRGPIAEAAPGEILRLIPTERVTLALFAPSVLLFLLQAPNCHEVDFSSLRRIVYAGSPMPLDVLRDAVATFKCEFGQMYGLTETTGAVTLLPPAGAKSFGNSGSTASGLREPAIAPRSSAVWNCSRTCGSSNETRASD
jgi:acyl-coenzyme A synthetase/AMP-(fatty) acid ligase